ncbi:PQQ-binding-like beta-propeller repeat protein [Winogradskyella litorisediminis]|uniref:PQQ-binding-like beta-propeller repeat protein n=1 Tax=Winogradskyella litorisediminis TaxID=1156618 RepID=A0ABW3N6L2_9FLAO
MKNSLQKPIALIAFMLFAFTNNAVAQRAETPDFQYDLGAKINEMRITPAGTMVVATNDGLVGVKPGQNELLFNFTDYGRVKPEELTYVPDSPYVIVGQTGFANVTSKKAVIDYVSGKVLFTTESKGWKSVTSCDAMIPQNKLVVSGLQKGGDKKGGSVTPKVAVYDLGTGELDYSFYLVEPGKVTMKYFAVTGTPLLLKDKLLIPTSQGILAKSKDGKTLWENKVKNINWMITDETEQEIYAFAASANLQNEKIYRINANGQPAWDDERKVKGKVSNFQILPQGIAVVSNVADQGKKGLSAIGQAKAQSNIYMLNRADGEDLWKKAPKTKGYVQHFYVMDDGILFGIREGGINKISFDGNTLFKKPLKTGPNILTMAETPQGLLYITSSDANIVDLKTGSQVWKKPLKYKKASAVSSVYDEKNDRYLISADENLISLNANDGTSEILAESDFEGKEDPTSVEIRDGGILLTSSQNMRMLNWEGDKSWHEYRRAPGKSAFGAILAGVTAVASTTMAMSAAARAGANRNTLGRYNSYGAEMDRAATMFSNIGTASFNEMAKRFKATSATKDSRFVLTKLDEGVGLVKLNKDTGAEEKQIILKDKKPEYQVDGFGGILYYKANDKTIYAYDLKK